MCCDDPGQIGQIFNIINEAIYDTVASVEEAVIESYFPGTSSEKQNETEPAVSSSSRGYPSKDDIAKSLNQLETLLCSSIDNQFDLLEIWLHRNVFNFPSLRDQLMKHFRFKHMSLWQHFYDQPHPANATAPGEIIPDWEKLKSEEEELWSSLDRSKSAYNKSKDDYHSLIAVSDVLDRKLAALKSVSSELNQITSESTTIYDPETNKPIDLSTQSSMLLARYRQLLHLNQKQEELKQAVNFKPLIIPQTNHSGTADGQPTIEDEDQNQTSMSQFSKYSRAINRLAKATTDDFLAELAEKGSMEIEKNEDLVEVLAHVSGKGKPTVPNTPLHHDRL